MLLRESLPRDDPWLALQIDQAVVYFGLIVENALLERDEIKVADNKTESRPRYDLNRQLLKDGFRLPASDARPATGQPQIPSGAGVKRWRMAEESHNGHGLAQNTHTGS